MKDRSTFAALESLQEEMGIVLKKYLREPVVSFSSKEQKQTGNAYQAVRLGDEVQRGFREGDRSVFLGIDLKGKSVVDLGCNLGEVCRDAARMGAKTVLGLEYDPFFVQMARYISAFNALDQVSFREADLTQAATYRGKYDIVSALSVFTYIETHLDKVADMVDELLIVETHAVSSGWERQYLKPLQQRFPFTALIDASDHAASSTDDFRLILASSRRPLDGLIAQRAREMLVHKAPFRADLSKSHIAHYDKVLSDLNITRGRWMGEVIEGLGRETDTLSVSQVVEDVRRYGLVQSSLYWRCFLIGYQDYKHEKKLDENNIYVRVMAQLIEAELYDSGFRDLFKEPKRALERLDRRYEMVDSLLNGKDDWFKHPIILFNPVYAADLKVPEPWKINLINDPDDVYPLAIDGHHRLFLAYALNMNSLPTVVVTYPELGASEKKIKSQDGLSDAVWRRGYEIMKRARMAMI